MVRVEEENSVTQNSKKMKNKKKDGIVLETWLLRKLKISEEYVNLLNSQLDRSR